MFGRGTQAKVAGKAARGAGKAALKGGARALTPRDPASTRFLKYGLFALTGFAVGALVARSREEREISPSFTGEAWGGSGTPLENISGVGQSPPPGSEVAPPPLQHPEDPNRTGPEREYSDPSSGPLVGRDHHTQISSVPEQQEEVEQRIRTRIGEDPRTTSLPRINVEVNDGVAELRGPAPSETVKEAAGEIAAQTEGVSEVRNLLTVDPQSSS